MDSRDGIEVDKRPRVLLFPAAARRGAVPARAEPAPVDPAQLYGTITVLLLAVEALTVRAETDLYSDPATVRAVYGFALEAHRQAQALAAPSL